MGYDGHRSCKAGPGFNGVYTAIAWLTGNHLVCRLVYFMGPALGQALVSYYLCLIGISSRRNTLETTFSAVPVAGGYPANEFSSIENQCRNRRSDDDDGRR